MASTIVLALVAICGYFIFINVIALRKNIAAAKRSGLPYAVTPVNVYNIAWLLSHKTIWVPLFEKLPTSWTKDWLPYLAPDWVWESLFEPFAKNGDIFLTVSPGAVHVWVANAEATRQITTRRDHFPKPLESYGVLEIFGRNVVTTEGAEWRQHRKITSPGFNEKNNAMVFAESIRQAQGMLRKWTGADGEGNITIEEVPGDTMRLMLHIISKVGFGVQLLWAGEKARENGHAKDAVYSGDSVPEGHTMDFEHALETLLERMIWVLMTPKWLLKHIPFEGAKKGYEAWANWSQYMNELFQQKVADANKVQQTEGMDIMGSLVRSAYSDSAVKRKISPGQAEKGQAGKTTLSDSDILGNAFVMIVAGHETTANTVHFSLMELATNPGAQRLVQKEVQAIFGNEAPENWDYEANINTLLGGMVGAVMNEELRLMPPVIAIPKRVSKGSDQDIMIDGKRHTLPAGAQVALATVCAHRNPKYWPTQPSKISDRPNDLNDFRPERWLRKPNDGTLNIDEGTDTEDEVNEFEGFTGESSSAQLFHPTRGSFIPFSDGARSCLGRRLAQVEVMAVLAVIFQEYSIELAVDEWATDEEVSKMGDREKRDVYAKAQEKSRRTMRGASTILTLKLQSGFIPVRIVKKGKERFVHLVD